MKFQVNDIVATGTEWRPNIFVITQIDPSRPKNPYLVVSLINGKQYCVGDSGLANKRIGVADPLVASMGGTVTIDSSLDSNYLRGVERASREINSSEGDDLKKWEKLASLKPGDTFTILSRGMKQMATFRYVTARGYKYVFVADNVLGKRYKYSLKAVVL